MIQNDGFRLRLIEKEDLNWLKELRQDENVNKFLGTFCLLNDTKQQKWFEGLISDSKRCYMAFEMTKTDSSSSAGNFENVTVLGCARITDIDLINRSMCVGGDIFPKFQSKGYAKELYRLIFKYGFDYMNMHRLYLYVLEDNERAISLYEKMGFIYEGTWRESILRDGKYKNYNIMSLLEQEYREKYGKN